MADDADTNSSARSNVITGETGVCYFLAENGIAVIKPNGNNIFDCP